MPNEVKPQFTIQEAQAKIASATTLDEVKEAVASITLIADTIAKESERLVAERAVEQAAAAELEKSKAEAIAAAEALKIEFAGVKQALAELQAAQEASQAEAKFNERMAALDETFDLADEERALLVDDVKGLDDESFAKWMSKSAVLMKEKTKAFKADKKKKEDEEAAAKAKCGKGSDEPKDKEEDKKHEDEESPEEKKKEGEASAAIDAVLKEAAASVKDPALAAPTVEGGKDLAKELREAFASGISIGGKKIKDIKTEKK